MTRQHLTRLAAALALTGAVFAAHAA